MNTPKTTLILTIATAAAAHLIVSVYSAATSHGYPIVFAAEPHAASQPPVTVAATPVTAAATPVTALATPVGATATPVTAAATPPADATTPTSPLAMHSYAGKQLDLAFCIDTTGSMGGEIETVKSEVKAVVAKLSSGNPKPIVRVALVAYRDSGDEYVSKVFPFSTNIDQVAADISNLAAEGGGDEPEAVDVGLHSALHELAWHDDPKTARVLFLIGDAPTHEQTKYSISELIADANERHIQINGIGCDGLEGSRGKDMFKRIALKTNGRYEDLTYRQEVANAAGKSVTIITSGGSHYVLTPGTKADWKGGASKLLMAKEAVPMLQGATNGTIGPQGVDATVISGVNTAGTVRVKNNLDSVVFGSAYEAMKKIRN